MELHAFSLVTNTSHSLSQKEVLQRFSSLFLSKQKCIFAVRHLASLTDRGIGASSRLFYATQLLVYGQCIDLNQRLRFPVIRYLLHARASALFVNPLLVVFLHVNEWKRRVDGMEKGWKYKSYMASILMPWAFLSWLLKGHHSSHIEAKRVWYLDVGYQGYTCILHGMAEIWSKRCLTSL